MGMKQTDWAFGRTRLIVCPVVEGVALIPSYLDKWHAACSEPGDPESHQLGLSYAQGSVERRPYLPRRTCHRRRSLAVVMARYQAQILACSPDQAAGAEVDAA
jgi:hypothetical protein